MPRKGEFEKIGDLFAKRATTTKAPAYQWQDLALKIIGELRVPPFKRSSIFKICKENTRIFVEACLADTKELCDGVERWKYFFKVVANRDSEKK